MIERWLDNSSMVLLVLHLLAPDLLSQCVTTYFLHNFHLLLRPLRRQGLHLAALGVIWR